MLVFNNGLQSCWKFFAAGILLPQVLVAFNDKLRLCQFQYGYQATAIDHKQEYRTTSMLYIAVYLVLLYVRMRASREHTKYNSSCGAADLYIRHSRSDKQLKQLTVQ